MNEELKKDMGLFAKYIHRLGVKYPKAYITGHTHYYKTYGDVTWSEKEPKNDEDSHYLHCYIDDSGELEFF